MNEQAPRCLKTEESVVVLALKIQYLSYDLLCMEVLLVTEGFADFEPSCKCPTLQVREDIKDHVKEMEHARNEPGFKTTVGPSWCHCQ
jgi:hypothetical protein